jgi:hypothetical protein
MIAAPERAQAVKAIDQIALENILLNTSISVSPDSVAF